MRLEALTLDAFLARRATDRRLARLTHDISLPSGSGLEFGPANNPTPLPEGLRVTYVDHSLEAGIGLPGATPIDYAWAGSGSLAAVLGRDNHDFAIAAQVGQYVPNLLGWLRGVHAALLPGAVFNLSLPDKRFMFDASRPVSTLAELIEADLLAYDRPSPRQVFGHNWEARSLTPELIWAGADPAQAPRMVGDVALALAHAEAVRAQTTEAYVPCHCWVFTPFTFLDLIEGATQLGLFPFVLNQLTGTGMGGFEFYVSMRRDVQDEPGALRTLQEGAISYLRSSLQRQRRSAKLMAND